MNLKDKTYAQLKALHEQIAALLPSKLEEARRQLNEEMARRATELGLEERRPLYSNPDDPSQCWSGKGPPPRWMKEQIAAGKRKEDFRTSG